MPERRSAALVLRIGVASSFTLIAAGLLLGMLDPSPRDPVARLSELGDLAVRFSGDALVHAGLLLLMLTPLVRVLVVGSELARRREHTFVALTVGVIFLLLATIAIGLLQGGTG